MKVKVDKNGKVVIPEATILRQCINYLITKGYEPGVEFGRVNTAGTYDPKIKCYRRNPWLLKGLPDIMCFAVETEEGRFWSLNKVYGRLRKLRMVGIECKSVTGELRPEQARWRDKFLSAGGLYILARDVDDVIKAGL